MGNCLRVKRGSEESPSSSTLGWGAYEEGDGDQWDSSLLASKKVTTPAEKLGFFDDDHKNVGSSADSKHNHKEIKIKITKKQLEKLLGEVDVHHIPVDQILAKLISANHGGGKDAEDDLRNLQHQRSWRPRLQSIPEVD